MSVVFAPREAHRCAPASDGAPVEFMVWRCDGCGSHWVLWCIDGTWKWFGEGPISKLRRWFKAVRDVRR